MDGDKLQYSFFSALFSTMFTLSSTVRNAVRQAGVPVTHRSVSRLVVAYLAQRQCR
jgi:hypothetical protein